jgi:hypothetical protein
LGRSEDMSVRASMIAKNSAENDEEVGRRLLGKEIIIVWGYKKNSLQK